MLGIKLQLQHKGGEDVSSFVTYLFDSMNLCKLYQVWDLFNSMNLYIACQVWATYYLMVWIPTCWHVKFELPFIWWHESLHAGMSSLSYPLFNGMNPYMLACQVWATLYLMAWIPTCWHVKFELPFIWWYESLHASMSSLSYLLFDGINLYMLACQVWATLYLMVWIRYLSALRIPGWFQQCKPLQGPTIHVVLAMKLNM